MYTMSSCRPLLASSFWINAATRCVMGSDSPEFGQQMRWRDMMLQSPALSTVGWFSSESRTDVMVLLM